MLGADSQTPASLQPASLLQLIWLASPALPVGGFSYSEGLEAAVESGFVHDEHSAADWLVDQLQLTLVRSELSVMAQAINAWRINDVAVLRQLNSWVLTTRETSELRAQTEQMGRSLLEWLRNHHTASAEQIATCATFNPTYPITFALAVAGTQANVRDGLLAFTFGWAENMTQSAIKAVPLGQSAGQRILSRLAAAIPDAVQQGMVLPEDDRQAFSPMWAILSAQHETQYSRLFRS